LLDANADLRAGEIAKLTWDIVLDPPAAAWRPDEVALASQITPETTMTGVRLLISSSQAPPVP
jgi:hypothetical protein